MSVAGKATGTGHHKFSSVADEKSLADERSVQSDASLQDSLEVRDDSLAILNDTTHRLRRPILVIVASIGVAALLAVALSALARKGVLKPMSRTTDDC